MLLNKKDKKAVRDFVVKWSEYLLEIEEQQSNMKSELSTILEILTKYQGGQDV